MLLIKTFIAKVTDISAVQKSPNTTSYRYMQLTVKSENEKYEDEVFRIKIHEKKFDILTNVAIGNLVEVQCGLKGIVQHKGQGQEPFYKLNLVITNLKKIR